ncbi:hypothetical protein CA295_14495, partial [Salmonella enterica subsp. enterica serovar Enteritidis]
LSLLVVLLRSLTFCIVSMHMFEIWFYFFFFFMKKKRGKCFVLPVWGGGICKKEKEKVWGGVKVLF